MYILWYTNPVNELFWVIFLYCVLQRYIIIHTLSSDMNGSICFFFDLRLEGQGTLRMHHFIFPFYLLCEAIYPTRWFYCQLLNFWEIHFWHFWVLSIALSKWAFLLSFWGGWESIAVNVIIVLLHLLVAWFSKGESCQKAPCALSLPWLRGWLTLSLIMIAKAANYNK